MVDDPGPDKYEELALTPDAGTGGDDPKLSLASTEPDILSALVDTSGNAAAGTLTDPRLPLGTVTAGTLTDGTLTDPRLPLGTVTAGTLTDPRLPLGTVTAGTLTDRRAASKSPGLLLSLALVVPSGNVTVGITTDGILSDSTLVFVDTVGKDGVDVAIDELDGALDLKNKSRNAPTAVFFTGAATDGTAGDLVAELENAATAAATPVPATAAGRIAAGILEDGALTDPRLPLGTVTAGTQIGRAHV